MKNNKPIRPLSHKYGRRIARQFATETAQKWRVLHGWDAQDSKEAVQNLTTIYLERLVNRGLVTPAT
jgi:hypothetical protein